MDKKLTYDKLPDGEIKKVLECCLYGDCQDCFYGGTDQRCCRDDLMQNCLDYFNRLRAENEELKETVKVLRVGVEQAHLIRKDGKSPFNLLKAEIKAEAYKECIEKLKEYGVGNLLVIHFDCLDNLLKKLVGDSG